MGRCRARVFLCLLACGLAVAGMAPMHAHADAPAATIRLPAGPLDDALKLLARQMRIQILYPPQRVAGRTTQALALPGNDPDGALRRLLQGSDLRAEQVSPGNYVIVAAPARQPATRPPRVANAAASARPAADARQALDTIMVVGSRIGRGDPQAYASAPTTIIDRATIQQSGAQSLFDILRQQPGMSAHPALAGKDGLSAAPAVDSTSLDSLGPRGTLFLVNGRRVVQAGAVSAQLGGLTDVDSIPLALVERIEILRGGASAVYGADAMAGVINIVLRRGAGNGAEVGMQVGASSHGDAVQQRITAGNGVQSAHHAWWAALSMTDDEALAGDARDWHRNRRPVSPYGPRIRIGHIDDAGDPVAGCPATRWTDAGCVFDPQRWQDLRHATRRMTGYLHAERDFGDGLSLDLDLRYGLLRTQAQAGPAAMPLRLPAGHPDAANGTALVHLFADAGPVRRAVDGSQFSATAALQGEAMRWHWNAGLSLQSQHTDLRVHGSVDAQALQSLLAAHRYRVDGRRNADEVLALLAPTLRQHGQTRLLIADAGLRGEPATLPGGPLQIAVGTEWRREQVRQDLQSGSATVPNAHRTTTAAYLEIIAPVHARLTLDAALRLDHERPFGGRMSPRFGLRWSPTNTWSLRGSWSSGYRPPSLFEMRAPPEAGGWGLIAQPASIAACALPVPDQSLCAVRRGAHANPDLLPELSTGSTLGVLWTPTADVSINIDRFRLRRRNEIIAGDAFSDPVAFPDSYRVDERGHLVAVSTYYANLAQTDVRGWQLHGAWSRRTQTRGRFGVDVAVQWRDHLSVRSKGRTLQEDVGGCGRPRLRALANLHWAGDAWQVAWRLRAAGRARTGLQQIFCVGPMRSDDPVNPGRVVHGLHVEYMASPRTAWWLDVDNLADRAPSDRDERRAGFDALLDDPRGRFIIVGFRHQF